MKSIIVSLLLSLNFTVVLSVSELERVSMIARGVYRNIDDIHILINKFPFSCLEQGDNMIIQYGEIAQLCNLAPLSEPLVDQIDSSYPLSNSLLGSLVVKPQLSFFISSQPLLQEGFLLMSYTHKYSLTEASYLRSLLWPKLIVPPLAQKGNYVLYENFNLLEQSYGETQSSDCLLLLAIVFAEMESLGYALTDEFVESFTFIDSSRPHCYAPAFLDSFTPSIHSYTTAFVTNPLHQETLAPKARAASAFRGALSIICRIPHSNDGSIYGSSCYDPIIYLVREWVSENMGSPPSFMDIASVLSLVSSVSDGMRANWREYLKYRGIELPMEEDHPMAIVDTQALPLISHFHSLSTGAPEFIPITLYQKVSMKLAELRITPFVREMLSHETLPSTPEQKPISPSLTTSMVFDGSFQQSESSVSLLTSSAACSERLLDEEEDNFEALNDSLDKTAVESLAQKRERKPLISGREMEASVTNLLTVNWHTKSKKSLSGTARYERFLRKSKKSVRKSVYSTDYPVPIKLLSNKISLPVRVNPSFLSQASAYAFPPSTALEVKNLSQDETIAYLLKQVRESYEALSSHRYYSCLANDETQSTLAYVMAFLGPWPSTLSKGKDSAIKHANQFIRDPRYFIKNVASLKMISVSMWKAFSEKMLFLKQSLRVQCYRFSEQTPLLALLEAENRYHQLLTYYFRKELDQFDVAVLSLRESQKYMSPKAVLDLFRPEKLISDGKNIAQMHQLRKEYDFNSALENNNKYTLFDEDFKSFYENINALIEKSSEIITQLAVPLNREARPGPRFPWRHGNETQGKLKEFYTRLSHVKGELQPLIKQFFDEKLFYRILRFSNDSPYKKILSMENNQDAIEKLKDNLKINFHMDRRIHTFQAPKGLHNTLYNHLLIMQHLNKNPLVCEKVSVPSFNIHPKTTKPILHNLNVIMYVFSNEIDSTTFLELLDEEYFKVLPIDDKKVITFWRQNGYLTPLNQMCNYVQFMNESGRSIFNTLNEITRLSAPLKSLGFGRVTETLLLRKYIIRTFAWYYKVYNFLETKHIYPDLPFPFKF